ncbi:MAG: hypothetical protein LKI24_10295 [Acidipropionibacterium sp.]|jgi:hypothetical protein|nr:hypothetical protein [Acidipropionibacterium sp.]
MPKTTTSTDHDQDIEAFIASIDPATMRDATHLRAISAARRAVADAETELREAVAAARAAGDSWTAIGVALHTSKQNAYRKFGARHDG